MSNAIEFRDVSKHYRGTEPRGGTLGEDLARVTERIRGRGVPRGVVRAVSDVNLDVKEGEATAIIGLNGAGKTTLLKLATRIAYPTSGVIRVRGRVGALIEVGTGMHPELTGRENVQLHGRILGLARRDIERRFDQIHAFSGIGDAIEQPVKQYSSGMQLRLGFAVAAHLEPDVLLVDEAIAVGDAGFQYRCVERMGELVREGRTLILVSHQLSAIETLCRRAILLDAGRVAGDGSASEVVQRYVRRVEDQRLEEMNSDFEVGEDLKLTGVTFHDVDGSTVEEIESGGSLTVRLHYRAARPIHRPIFNVGISSGHRGPVAAANQLVDGERPALLEGTGYVDCTFMELPLQPQTFEVWASVLGEAGHGYLIHWQRLRAFRVKGDIGGAGEAAATYTLTGAPVKVPYQWSYGTSEEQAGPEAQSIDVPGPVPGYLLGPLRQPR